MTSVFFEREKRKNEIWLQSHGWQKAVKASELKPGMVTMWNGGCTETIKTIETTKSGKSVKMIIIDDGSGKEYDRTMRVDRLVAIA